MANFKTVEPDNLEENVFKLIGTEWMLITAGNSDEFNTMTASWGGLGVLWHKQVCFVFIRPQRYTFDFMEKNEFFSLSFFSEKYREVLNYCGSNSGRDVDKIAETGLSPAVGDSGAVYFSESKLVLECRKIYYQDLNPSNFLDMGISSNYMNRDYHRMYIGEVISSRVRDN